MTTTGQDLTLRRLNRTLLRRQLLDARADVPVAEAVGRLLGVQAQEPNWAHVGVWSRVAGFRRDDLGTAVEQRELVRSPLLRGTQHLVTAADYRWLRPTLQPVLDRLARAGYYTEQTAGIDPDDLVAAALPLLESGPVLRRDVAAALVEHWPGRRGAVLAGAVEALWPVVHDPGTSAWGSWWSRRNIAVADARTWIDAPMLPADPSEAVRRYLAAYGPATVRDVQAFTGLTRLGAVVADLRPELVVHRGPDGVELLDLADGVLADEDAPAPVRFVAAFDNAVLGHRDRTRILPEQHRTTVMPGYSMVHATVLVDGFVAGTWTVDGGTLVVHPLEPLPAPDTDAVLAEGAAAAAFLDLEGPVLAPPA